MNGNWRGKRSIRLTHTHTHAHTPRVDENNVCNYVPGAVRYREIIAGKPKIGRGSSCSIGRTRIYVNGSRLYSIHDIIRLYLRAILFNRLAYTWYRFLYYGSLNDRTIILSPRAGYCETRTTNVN